MDNPIIGDFLDYLYANGAQKPRSINVHRDGTARVIFDGRRAATIYPSGEADIEESHFSVTLHGNIKYGVVRRMAMLMLTERIPSDK